MPWLQRWSLSAILPDSLVRGYLLRREQGGKARQMHSAEVTAAGLLYGNPDARASGQHRSRRDNQSSQYASCRI